jgi:hypothetical protein
MLRFVPVLVTVCLAAGIALGRSKGFTRRREQ